MANKMLIDTAHREETRVVVVRGTKIEEFDFESASRLQLRGNIYLAKITRVEPSLQAAFVEYGGNRHGFLAFSEIHPDYYQIPMADKQALLAQDTADEIAAEADEEAREAGGGNGADKTAKDAVADQPDDADTSGDTQQADNANGADEKNGADDGDVESVGAEDALEEVPDRARHRWRSYKIQEVIKKNQIILVQVVKEERGKKGAALTTYLSLAGRHCVLMPNTARGGGISRKITNPADRRRLREIAHGLNVTEGTGLIVRTAGANRTKAEIKRDFDYLQRMWETVRTLTLESSAPTLVYEEGSLIKRSIRDLYNKEIDEIIVEGDDGYKEAKAFMRMLMPSHAKHVKQHKDTKALFTRHQVERQLDALFDPVVTLKSGGYLVINQTEALVAIDINSGKATRERHIEDTALNTNLEAAAEIVRQLRLRDLAGLIVIDFIDMEQRRNNRAVERRLKECLKGDRARIQVGRISHFGLLEMSRQRLRAGVLEGSTAPCLVCEGRGFVRSVESSALQILRAIEEKLMERRQSDMIVRAPSAVASYLLNQKRDQLKTISDQNGLTLFVEADPDLPNSKFTIGRLTEALPDYVRDRSESKPAAAAPVQDEEGEETRQSDAPRKRRRRGGRGRKARTSESETRTSESETRTDDAPAEAAPAEEQTATSESNGEEETKAPSRRRRGRRGGRRVQQRREARNKADDDQPEQKPESEQAAESEQSAAPVDAATAEAPEQSSAVISEPALETPVDSGDEAEAKPKPKRRAARSKTKSKADDGDADTKEKKKAPKRKTASKKKADDEADDASASGPAEEDKKPAKRPARRRSAAKKEEPVASLNSDGNSGKDDAGSSASGDDGAGAPDQPARKGWWQRNSAAS